MTTAERILQTLNFQKVEGGGTVAETFYPWIMSLDRWVNEGLDPKFTSSYLYERPSHRYRRYFNDTMTEHVFEYEQFLGYDGIKRMSFRIPFKGFDTQVLGENDEYTHQRDEDGWERYYYKTRALVKEVKPVVTDQESWQALKLLVQKELEEHCTQENLEAVYGKYKKSHERGDYSLRFRASGFFWAPRELLGIEEQLIAFYEEPELLHEINQFILDTYKTYFDKIFDIIKPEVILFEEDLSGANGPMISGEMFDEFVGSYYKKLIPFLKKKGVHNIFVDTDGDFEQLIPNFRKVGVDGFLPMDVNAGMDIVKVRKKFPDLKFIGGYNKLAMAEGKEAIDQEFKRILPVIRQGGYVPGADHQVAPSTPFENYQYYIKRLREVMQEAGVDAKIK